MEKIQLIGSSSPYESNRASPTGGRRPLPFMRDLMGLSLSYLSMSDIVSSAIDFLKKDCYLKMAEKRLLPEDGPVLLKHVVKEIECIYFNDM
jgi:hypothetical protein